MESQQPNLSSQARAKAIEQFARRFNKAEGLEKYRIEDLYAEEPCLFYCEACGTLIEVLAEDYFFPPFKLCSQCQGLYNQGWLEAAQQEVGRPPTPPPARKAGTTLPQRSSHDQA